MLESMPGRLQPARDSLPDFRLPYREIADKFRDLER